MKQILKYIVAVCCSSMILFSGCIEDTFPTSGATSEQLGSSAKATEALLWAIPAFMNNFNTLNRGSNEEEHFDWGYGSIMHYRDVLTGDLPLVAPYNGGKYLQWGYNTYMGGDYVFAQYFWNYYYKYILTTNNLIQAVDVNSASETQLGYVAVAKAFRALLYLDLARMYEFLPNDVTNAVNSDGNNVEGLTVPIVTELTTEAEARNNPRVSHADMYEFILSDLNFAEEFIDNVKMVNKTLPNLAVVQGLKARLYMWNLDYANAKIYAENAIGSGKYSITTEKDWLSTTTGFNDLSNSAWMWGTQATGDDDVVQTGILNWTSWMSNETDFGYAVAGAFVQIDKNLYEKMNNTDFRKLAFLAPEDSELYGKSPMIDPALIDYFPVYGSLKFRPNEGNMADYKVAASSAYPLMRIEEMYFIQMESAAQSGSVSTAVDLLKSFMGNRDTSFDCTATSKEDVINAIITQKRIEFFGEGISFFDMKRLNMPVTRGYENTNWLPNARFNTAGRPAWSNFCIVRTEGNNNQALVGYNNPDPSGLYTPWK